jgi:dihydrofolate reductase/dihydrofolate reductase (trimethoprim resistance protein)
MEIDGNVSFPRIDKSKFRKVFEQSFEGEIPYTYYTYERIYS